MQKNTVFILSGPAWAGKNTLWDAIEHAVKKNIKKVVTTTTRGIRPWEVDGIHYHFISKAEFEDKIKSDDLIEYAIVHENYYGSTYTELADIDALWKAAIYIIDVTGMKNLKAHLQERWYNVKTIFLLPPSLEEMKNRMKNRWTETEEQFQIRLRSAEHEFTQQEFYDIKIVNDDIEKAKEELLTILQA